MSPSLKAACWESRTFPDHFKGYCSKWKADGLWKESGPNPRPAQPPAGCVIMDKSVSPASVSPLEAEVLLLLRG